jgi:hypothetical protein
MRVKRIGLVPARQKKVFKDRSVTPYHFAKCTAMNIIVRTDNGWSRKRELVEAIRVHERAVRYRKQRKTSPQHTFGADR